MFFTKGDESVNLTHVARMSFFDSTRRNGTVTVGFYFDGGPAYLPIDVTAAEEAELRAMLKALGHNPELDARQAERLDAMFAKITGAMPTG